MKTTKKVATTRKATREKPVLKPARSDYRLQLVVQFNKEINLPYRPDIAKYIKEQHVGPWELLAKKYPGINIEPLFSNIDPKTLMGWIKKAKEMDPSYTEGHFFQYFRVKCPANSSAENICNDFASWIHVKNAYIEKPTISSIVNYNDDELAVENPISPSDPYQRYLNDAPEGISSKTVWDNDVIGSDGSELKFIDIEKGWTLDHEDLNGQGATCLYGIPEDSGRAHGTSILGIVCAEDNGLGCVGIAPKLTKVDVIAQNPSGIAPAILESLRYLNFGDVLLIEATNTEDYEGIPSKVPVETTNPEFDAIRLATALGIVVIEPGGNGDDINSPVNYNDFQKNFLEILNPTSADFRDSGAIIVTAAQSGVTNTSGVDSHIKMPWAPYGDRVDCYAWGEEITAPSSDTSGGTDLYVHNFDGTSGAAAIVAGAVLSMQGMVQAGHGYRFSPGQIRQILRNPSYGTQMSRHITGTIYELLQIYMPDLLKFTSLLLNLPPDLYLRDFVGDTGVPHSGSIASSPDVILKNNSVADPQAAFGQGSGTENSNTLSDTAKIGQTNFLYFRALNKGGSTPTNTKVSVFYSIPATLLTPSLLNFIGEIGFPSPIPTGDVLTVSDELQWLVPGPHGHYCFVAVISCDEDPELDPRTIPDWDWEKYRRYIRENNNVTWRNFNMVLMPPPAPSPAPDPEPDPEPDQVQEPAPGQDPVDKLPKRGWIALDFISPGIPDGDEKMNLEIISQLPRGSKVLLQMPLSWKRNIFKGSPYVWHNKRKRLGFAHVPANRTSLVENILFKANSVTKLKLFIYIPEKLRNRNYTIAIKQTLNGNEMGRLSWQLVPHTKKPKRNG